MLFDIIPLSEFKHGKSIMGQKRRSALLKQFKGIFDKVGNIGVVPQTEIDLDTAVGEMQFMQFNKDAIDNGYEGIMIKDPNAIYECKRSVSWLKQKPFIEVSLSIVAVEEGTGKNQGRMGAIICEGEDDGKTIAVNVGSGFTDDQRTEYWNDKESLEGQIVEVRADAATRNQDSEDVWSLRFPRFLQFRGFVAGEKL
jgi:DNA ligase-1